MAQAIVHSLNWLPKFLLMTIDSNYHAQDAGKEVLASALLFMLTGIHRHIHQSVRPSSFFGLTPQSTALSFNELPPVALFQSVMANSPFSS